MATEEKTTEKKASLKTAKFKQTPSKGNLLTGRVSNRNNRMNTGNVTREALSLERMIELRMNNNESFGDEAPIIFTEKSEGVQAGYNIKTDRFDLALDGMTAIDKSRIAKSESKPDLKVVKDDDSNDSKEVG